MIFPPSHHGGVPAAFRVGPGFLLAPGDGSVARFVRVLIVNLRLHCRVLSIKCFMLQIYGWFRWGVWLPALRIFWFSVVVVLRCLDSVIGCSWALESKQGCHDFFEIFIFNVADPAVHCARSLALVR